MLNRILSSAIVAGALLIGAQSTLAAIVTNGGFETGDLTGWTLTGDSSFTAVDSGAPFDGNFAFYSGSFNGATLSQSLATASGQRYRVTFWLQNEVDAQGGAVPNDFGVFIDGVELLSLSDVPGFSYTHYVLDFAATGASTNLAFTFQHGPAFWDLDNVAAASIPEPATALLVGLAGIAAFWGPRRRRSPTQHSA